MAIITIGRIDKKLLLMVLMIIITTTNLFGQKEGRHLIEGNLTKLESIIGPIIAGIILHIIFRKKRVQQIKQKKSRKSFKYIIYLFILRLIHLSVDYFYPFFVREPKYRFVNIRNTMNGITIMLLTLSTFILLKYKYYIHHYITMSLYCVLGISMDLILGGFWEINLKYAYIFIVFLIDDAIVYCFLKYMMDKIYYQYTEVMIYNGIIELILNLAFMAGLGYYEYKNEIKEEDIRFLNIFKSIQTYFKETNPAIIIFFQFLYFLVNYGLMTLLMILIIYYLSPNYMIIPDQIGVIEELLIYQTKKENRFYTIIPFALQIICLLFYFEILELNFFGLNKNTVKNIQEREKDEGKVHISREQTNTKIELTGEYILEDQETTNKDGRTSFLTKNNTTISEDKLNFPF